MVSKVAGQTACETPTDILLQLSGDLDEISNISSERDDGSQKRIVNKRPSGDGIQVNVQKDFKVAGSSYHRCLGCRRNQSEPWILVLSCSNIS